MGDSKPGREELQQSPKTIEESQDEVASPGLESPDQENQGMGGSPPEIQSPRDEPEEYGMDSPGIQSPDHQEDPDEIASPDQEDEMRSESADFRANSPHSIPPTSPNIESSTATTPIPESGEEGCTPGFNGKEPMDNETDEDTERKVPLSGSPLQHAVAISDDDGELSDHGDGDTERSKSPADKRSGLEKLKTLRFTAGVKKVVFGSEVKKEREKRHHIHTAETEVDVVRKRERPEKTSSPARRSAASHHHHHRRSRSKTPEEKSHRKRRFEEDAELKREKKVQPQREPKPIVQPNTLKQRADVLIAEENKVSHCDETELRKMVTRAYEMVCEHEYLLNGRTKLVEEMRKMKGDEDHKIQKAIDSQPEHLKKVALEKYQEIKGIPPFMPPFPGMPPMLGMPPFGMPPFPGMPPPPPGMPALPPPPGMPGMPPPPGMPGAPPFAPPLGMPPPFPPLPNFGGPPTSGAPPAPPVVTSEAQQPQQVAESLGVSQEITGVQTSKPNFSNFSQPPIFSQPPPVKETVTASKPSKLLDFTLPPPPQQQQKQQQQHHQQQQQQQQQPQQAPYAQNQSQQSQSQSSMPNLSLPPPSFNQPSKFHGNPQPLMQHTPTKASQPSAPYKAAVPLGFGGGGLVNGSAPTGTPAVAANQLNSFLTKMISNMAQQQRPGTGMMAGPLHRGPPPHMRNIGGRGSPYTRDNERKGGRGGRAMKKNKDDNSKNAQTTMEA